MGAHRANDMASDGKNESNGAEPQLKRAEMTQTVATADTSRAPRGHATISPWAGGGGAAAAPAALSRPGAADGGAVGDSATRSVTNAAASREQMPEVVMTAARELWPRGAVDARGRQ